MEEIREFSIRLYGKASVNRSKYFLDIGKFTAVILAEKTQPASPFYPHPSWNANGSYLVFTYDLFNIIQNLVGTVNTPMTNIRYTCPAYKYYTNHWSFRIIFQFYV
jgi:hypothetical protein